MTIAHSTRVHRALFAAAFAGLTLTACSETPTTPSRNVPHPSFDRAEPTYDFSSIDVPGGFGTQAQGISTDGTVVGWYWTADGRQHGFVMKRTTFTTVDYPGAFYTDVRGIGPSGELVGTFAGESEEAAAFHGYRMSPTGEFTAVRANGFLYEILQRVLPDGTILGCGHDHNTTTSMTGVTINSSGTTVVAPTWSMNNGGTPDGRHVAGFYNIGHNEAYTIDDGVLTSFMLPGSTQTAAWDMNPRGDIVGVAVIAGVVRGFVRTEAGFTTLTYPGATVTRAFGVNARGDVVGTYTAGGVVHGFIARRVS